jgi:hypothetical protein
MSEPSGKPALYRVSYSERVRTALRELIARAKNRGLAARILDALKELDKLLHVYPQFGEPLYNLKLEPAQVWVGSIPPLVMRYILDEERRLVMVVEPILPLPNSGLDP